MSETKHDIVWPLFSLPFFGSDMDYIFRYLRLLNTEFAEMTYHMKPETVGLLGVVTIAAGWYCLRGTTFKR